MMIFKKISKIKFIYRIISFKLNTNVLYDEKHDYYEILELKEIATTQEIKESYYRLAKIHHPDVKGDEQKFKNINLAFEILKNDNEKKIYDELRKQHLSERSSRIFSKRNSSNNQNNDYFYNNASYKNYKDFNNTNFNQKNNYKDYDTYKANPNSEEDNFSQRNYESYYEKDFEEMMRNHNETLRNMYRNSKKHESNFQKFKINYSFSKYDPIYPKFSPHITHRHHLENRKKQFILAKEKVDRFMLPDEIKKDKIFMEIYSELDDSDKFDNRLTLRKILMVNSKKSIFIFFLILSCSTLCLIKQI